MEIDQAPKKFFIGQMRWYRDDGRHLFAGLDGSRQVVETSLGGSQQVMEAWLIDRRQAMESHLPP